MKQVVQRWLFKLRRHELVDREAEASVPDTTDTVVGERSIASVNRGRSLQARLSNLMAMGLMAALGVGLLTWYYSRTLAQPAQTQRAAQAASQARAQGEMALPALGRVDAPVMAMHPTAEQLLGPAPVLPEDVTEAYRSQVTPAQPAGAAYSSNNTAAPEKSPSQQALERRLSGPAFSAVNAGAPGSAAAQPPNANVGAGNPVPAAGQGPVASLLQPTTTPAVTAQVLPTQRLLLPKGAFIDCTLETAIDSSLPGLTTCVTATDTFGADGKVVLLERGTKLVGETRGEVQQGMSRLFVLWTEARTPTGVVVPLASPGTDELGRSGLSGQVNRHFMDRFGAAILVSVIDGIIQSAVMSRTSRNNSDTVVINPSSTQEILTEVLKSTINIPPTITKQNGDRIQILVARDLDFRSVYELRSVNAAR